MKPGEEKPLETIIGEASVRYPKEPARGFMSFTSKLWLAGFIGAGLAIAAILIAHLIYGRSPAILP